MTISTDAAIDFFGTQTSIISTSSAISDGAISAETEQFTNNDDAREADVTVMLNYSVAPDEDGPVQLRFRKMNIDGTNDEPALTYEEPGHWACTFRVQNVTTAQYHSKRIRLPNWMTSSVYEFQLKNDSGQQIPANWTLKITPIAPGPHA